MKKLIASWVLLCLTFVFLLGFSLPAKAEETRWVRVLDDQTALYPTPSPIKITCYVEKSYYLRVLEETSDFYFVQIVIADSSFPSISGYVDKKKVDISFDVPQLPYYPSQKITVSSSNASLHFSPLSSSTVLIVATNTQTLCYYGSISADNKLWYYVYFASNFGYVDSNSVTAPQIALHPTPLPTIPVDDPPIGNDPSDPKPPPDPYVSIGEVLMIVFVAVLSVGLVLALFLPQNVAKKEKESRFH